MQTILFQKTLDLYLETSKLPEKFPKKDRYGLGLKMENNCLVLLELIISAEQAPPVLKDKILSEASVKTEIAKIFIRICMEKKLIKETGYFSLTSKLVEIGKMIGGWKKSLRQ